MKEKQEGREAACRQAQRREKYGRNKKMNRNRITEGKNEGRKEDR